MNTRPIRSMLGMRMALAGLTLFAAGALSAGTADEAVEALWKFVSPQGHLYDFIGDVPTPQDCAENRPNAMGYWCPIENAPMFTGPFLQAMALRAKRTGAPEDARRCRVLAEGLLLLASVSDVPGFVARGVGTDGKCHFPIGSPDQTVPWFLGLDAYLHSGLCDPALKARIVAKMKDVGEALAAAGWRTPMEPPFAGERQGSFRNGSLPFRAATQYLLCLRALADATGDEKWMSAYRRALNEKSPRSVFGGLTYLEICELGCGHDQEVQKSFKVAPNGLWIYVGCAQGCLATLAAREEDAAVAQKFRTGLARSADYARASLALAKGYPNVAERPFKYANWRAGWNWRPQKTQAEARAVASNANRNREVLGNRKDVERKTMTAPLSAAAICAYAGKYREEVLATLAHYDYSTIALSEFYAAPLAFELLNANTTTNKQERESKMKRTHETSERNEKMNVLRTKLLALAAAALTAGGLLADARTLWVDCDGAATTPDGSESAPYATIQAAVDAASAGDTVKVRPGVYGDGENSAPGGTVARVVIDKAITLESTDGKHQTFIVGQKGTSRYGTGSDAVRCLVICGGAAAVVKGFTLSGGAAGGGSKNYEASFGGCVLMTGNARDAAVDAQYSANDQAFVVDSIVRDGFALRGGNVSGGNLVRCLVANGTSPNPGCGSYFANSYLSVYVENGGEETLGAIVSGTHVSATVQQSAGRFFYGYNLACFQCVFVGDAVLHHAFTTTKPSFQFCVVPRDEVYATLDSTEPQAFVASSVNCVVDASATLAAPTVGDFRHVSAVQAETARGTMGFNEKIPEAYRTVDFNGNPLVTDKTAPCYAGAVQTEVCATAPAGDASLVVRLGDFTKGRLCVNGSPVLFDGTWPFDGETVQVSGVGCGDYRLAYCTDATGARCYPGADGAITLKPKAGRMPDLTGVFLKPVWADAANGDDATADGTEAKPYRTLQAAYEKAAASDEDCRLVLAKPGDYNAGGAVASGLSLTNRLCMTNGNVLVRSTAGRDVTFITGASATESPDKFGNGPGSVRCLRLTSGWVQGFTLRGGRTLSGDLWQDDYLGGGVYVGSGNSINLAATAPGLRDCTITNCSAVRASAVYGGNYDNCLLVDNDVIKGYRVIYAGYLRQCFIADVNDAGTAVNNCNTLESCTVVAPCHYALASCTRVANSVIHRPTRTDVPSWSKGLPAFYNATANLAMSLENCAIDPNETCAIAETATGATFTKTGCLETLANADFGAGSRPLATSAYVDAGGTSFVDLWDEPWEDLYDALGNPRVSNGARDLGGIEFDWRAVYAARLGKGVTVTAAPASATAADDGVLLVGGDLVLDWTRTGAKSRQVEFEVTGTGTLHVQVNGATVGEYGAGRQTVSFESATGTDTLTLTYVPGADDAGGAVVCACRRVQGSLLIVR